VGKKSPKEGSYKEVMEPEVLKPPSVTWSISTKERESKLDKTPNLEKPFPTKIAHLEMEAAYAFFNVINTLYL
jgi:hypothetical protein